MLLPERQAEMRELSTHLLEDTLDRKEVLRMIRQLIKFEEKSAEGSQATIDRSEHAHVKKSGQAALANRRATIDWLEQALGDVKAREYKQAAGCLLQAANCGGKKSVKAARKAPTVALFVEYLAETDPDFQSWLAARGIRS